MTTCFCTSRARKGQLVTTAMTEPWHDGPVDADLSHTAFAQPLTQAWQTYAAHKDGADIQTMRNLWRASDKEMRKVINTMMGVG